MSDTDRPRPGFRGGTVPPGTPARVPGTAEAMAFAVDQASVLQSCAAMLRELITHGGQG
jgi:hypothetical protein